MRWIGKTFDWIGKAFAFAIFATLLGIVVGIVFLGHRDAALGFTEFVAIIGGVLLIAASVGRMWNALSKKTNDPHKALDNLQRASAAATLWILCGIARTAD